jgi:uncharacterized protein
LKITRYPRSLAVTLLQAYKWAISPMFPPSCRYTPTCSEYAAEAIDRYGIVRGSAMAVWRLLRCHPFVRGGYDPVPRDAHVAPDALVRGVGTLCTDGDSARSLAPPDGRGRPSLEGQMRSTPLTHA